MVLKKKWVIKPQEIRIEKMGEAHIDALEGFCSYEGELEDFLKEDALAQQKQHISVTYLWFKRKTHELIGYITLCPDCVKTKNLKEGLAKKIRDKGISYKSLPTLKIGRLCVSDTFLRKGVGTLMIQFAVHKAIDMNFNVGCRFLYLDAKRNKDNSRDVIHFYKKIGFELYKNRNGRETPMYLDLVPFIKMRESTNNQ